ncbi:MAG: DivIVA domain-containing protein [Eubacteriales bacterium]|nr:DivIVA domain-containing protein [Eubacteriales bacterium]
MNTQELLTYVEELVFKTSMFGYDKDEVDIQLDKICDEVEAIVKEKDKQIEALKKGQSIIVPDLREAAKEEKEEVGEESDEEDLKREIASLKEQLNAAQKRVEEAEKQAEEAEERAIEAEKKAAAAEGKAAVAETKAAAQAAAVPPTKDEAYEQYIRNADLLCRQLSDIQNKQDTIVQEAETKAAKIIEDAEARANEIVGGIQARRSEEQQKYNELLTEKKKMITSLHDMVAEVEELLKKTEEE